MRESFTCAVEHFDELRRGEVGSDHDRVLYAPPPHPVQHPGVADWNLFQLLVGTAIGNDRDWAQAKAGISLELAQHRQRSVSISEQYDRIAPPGESGADLPGYASNRGYHHACPDKSGQTKQM